MSVLHRLEPATDFSIHPKTRMGAISLSVRDLDPQLAFYQQALGFRLHWRDGHQAGLGAGGADFLLLTEAAGLKRYQRVTGLYHVAYLFPDRRQLAIAMARQLDRKSTRLNSSHTEQSRMPSSA